MKHTDLTYLKEISNGSNEFIREMISLFIKHTPIELNNIELYFKNKNWQSLRNVFHKMKASMAFVGLKEIESILRQAEEYALNETNLDQLPSMIMKVKQTCNEAISELEEELHQFS